MDRPLTLVVTLVVLLSASVAASGTAGAVAGRPTTGAVDPVSEVESTAGVTAVSGCREIRNPGHYRLEADIVDSTTDRCIRIYASDVVFDGAGHRIDGVDKYLFDDYGTETSTKGIAVESATHGLSNVTVRNVVVTDYGYGIWVGETVDGRVVNNTFRSNGIYGLYVGYGAYNNTIADNRVRETRSPELDVPGKGIVVANYAHDNEIVGNDVRGSEKFGIEVSASNRTRIANNVVADSGSHGIVGTGEGTEVVDNVVEESRDTGIRLVGAEGVVISGNEVRDSNVGMTLERSDDAVIGSNVFRGNDETGIRLHGGVTEVWGDISNKNVSIVDNRVTRNGGPGITIPQNNNDSVIRDNVVSDNGEEGIRLARNSGNRLVNNTISGHAIGVVLVEVGANVLVGNTYRDNSEWDIVSRRHSTPITVEDAAIGDGTKLSYTGRNVAIVGAPTGPDPLPEHVSAIGRFLKVWPEEGDRSWVELTLQSDASTADEGSSLGLWTNTGTWSEHSTDSEAGSPTQFSTGVTELDGTQYFVVGASRESPTPGPSPPQTQAPGQPGFGVIISLVALFGVGLLLVGLGGRGGS